MIIKKLKIRKAVVGDFQAINDLYYATYNLYHQNIPKSYKMTPKNPLIKGGYLNMLDDKNCLVAVAVLNNQVAGFVYSYTEKEKNTNVTYGYNRMCIAEISVFPDHQRQGIGSRLIKEAEKWARDRQLSDLVVLVYAFNKKAVLFFETQGYKPYSIQLTKQLK